MWDHSRIPPTRMGLDEYRAVTAARSPGDSGGMPGRWHERRRARARRHHPDAQRARQCPRRGRAPQPGARRDIVLLNAGCAIYAADKTDTIAKGIKLAQISIDSKAALEKLRLLKEYSQ